MELIVAVYADLGIGYAGTEPVTLAADRQFFREITRGAMVIVGRRTAEDFPGGRPLPGRVNVLLSRSGEPRPGFLVCGSPEEAVLAARAQSAFVIGGGSVYRQMLPLCSGAYVTKLHCAPVSDTFFPDLDADPRWRMRQILRAGVENGIAYEICRYERVEN